MELLRFKIFVVRTVKTFLYCPLAHIIFSAPSFAGECYFSGTPSCSSYCSGSTLVKMATGTCWSNPNGWQCIEVGRSDNNPQCQASSPQGSGRVKVVCKHSGSLEPEFEMLYEAGGKMNLDYARLRSEDGKTVLVHSGGWGSKCREDEYWSHDGPEIVWETVRCHDKDSGATFSKVLRPRPRQTLRYTAWVKHNFDPHNELERTFAPDECKVEYIKP